MHLARIIVPGLLALGLARPVAAQEPVVTTTEPDFVLQEPGPSPIFGFVGGGASFPMADAADRFNVGYGFHAGIGYNFSRFLGAHLEGFWSYYGVQNEALGGATELDANHRMQYGSIDAVAHLLRGPFNVYVLGGGGLYYRRVEITQFAGTTVVPYCDPWLYYCYPSVVPVEQILGTRSSTDFGLNGGLGASVRLTRGLAVYLEGRYHYMWGPEVGGQNINGQYIPVMLGLRFE